MAMDLSLLSEAGSLAGSQAGSLAELEREQISQLEMYLRRPQHYPTALSAAPSRELLVPPNLTPLGSTLHEVNLRAAQAQVDILSSRCEALEIALKEAGSRCEDLERRAGVAERAYEESERQHNEGERKVFELTTRVAELTREKEEQDGRYKKAVRRLRQDLANEKSEIEKRAELRVKESQLDVLEKEKRLAQSAKKSRALEREMERLKAEVVKVGDLTTHEATLKSQALLSQMRDSMLEHAKRTKLQYDKTLSTYRATMIPKEEHLSTISRLEAEWKRVIAAVREEGEERARHGREVDLTRVRAVEEVLDGVFKAVGHVNNGEED
mmetsp:Transcript_20424/g.42603  ORF Transcript_20424/g.42603 Transcript_20424/m.42603 type:complete len:326 (-) Transcript_20424:15-992(-)